MTSDLPRDPWPDLSELSRADWAEAIRSLVATEGGYIELDEDHHVLQVGSGDRLVITFENATDIRNNQEDAIPLGLRIARMQGVSVMIVMCLKPTWFRAPAVYDFFDLLADDGELDEYDHVLFYGAGMGGYAAAAFSVSAPGADVIAISPQATLDPRLTEWDPRFVSMRKLSFTDRYGYAPAMCEAARHVLVLYNPEDELEAMHAALFARAGDPAGAGAAQDKALTRFRCRHLGPDLQGALEDLRILDDVIRLGLNGRLDLQRFARLYRKRRDNGPYLRALLAEVEDQDRMKLLEWLVGSVLPRKNMPKMRRAQERLKALAEKSPAE